MGREPTLEVKPQIARVIGVIMCSQTAGKSPDLPLIFLLQRCRAYMCVSTAMRPSARKKACIDIYRTAMVSGNDARWTAAAIRIPVDGRTVIASIMIGCTMGHGEGTGEAG